MENERMLILQMVAEKKITAAEAVELLKALEPSSKTRAGWIPEMPTPPRPPRPPEMPEPPEPPRYAGERLSEDIASRIGSLVEGLISNFGFGFGDGFKFEETVEGTFDAGDFAPEIDFKTSNGRVAVEGWNQPGYMVKLIKRVKAPSEQEAMARAKDLARVERDGGKLSIRFNQPQQSTIFGGCGLAIIAFLPKDRTYRFLLQTANGRVEMKDLKGTTVDATTSNGVVKMDTVEAERVETRTSNGKVMLKTSARDVKAHSSNGRITIIPVGTAGDTHYDLHTSNGSVKVQTGKPNGIGFSFDLRTTNGKINVEEAGLEYETNEKHHGMRRVKARSKGFDSASCKISVAAHTSNGSISVGDWVEWE
jgi:hypothetical protein